MYITKCNPLKEFGEFGKDMDSIFSEMFPMQSFFTPTLKSARKSEAAAPSLDMIDKGEAILVRVDMPGIKKNDISITIERNTLKITAEQEHKDEYAKEDYFYKERSHARLARSVVLPVKIDSDKITASLKEGILEITLTKAQEIKPKKIKVETN